MTSTEIQARIDAVRLLLTQNNGFNLRRDELRLTIPKEDERRYQLERELGTLEWVDLPAAIAAEEQE